MFQFTHSSPSDRESVEKSGSIVIETLKDILDKKLPDCLRTVGYFIPLAIIREGTHLTIVQQNGNTILA